MTPDMNSVGRTFGGTVRFAILGLIILACLLSERTARAGCAPDPAPAGGSVTCSATDADGFVSLESDLTITVIDGAAVIGDLPAEAAIEIGDGDHYVSGTTIVNNGTLGRDSGDQSISGIRVYGSDTTVTNVGSIATDAYGIALTPLYAETTDAVERIVNTGSILGGLTGIYVNGGNSVEIENFAEVEGTQWVGIGVDDGDVVSIFNGPGSSVRSGLWGIAVNLSSSSPRSSQIDIVQGQSSTISAIFDSSSTGLQFRNAILVRDSENASVTLEAGTAEAPTTVSSNIGGVGFWAVANPTLELQANSRIVIEGDQAANGINVDLARTASVTVGEGALIQAPGAGIRMEATEASVLNDGRIVTTSLYSGRGIQIYVLDGVSQKEYPIEVVNNGEIVIENQGLGMTICCSGAVLVENYGDILANQEWGAGIFYVSSGQILNEGSITSGKNASAVEMASDGPQRATLVNRGRLLSVGGGSVFLDEPTRDGIPLATGYTTFTQYGVSAENGTVINQSGGTIEVTGDISSAVRMTRKDTESSRLENYGTISGNGGRLGRFDDRDSAGAIVRHDRFVYGAIDGGPGIETVINAGTISGSIGLAAGADSLTNTGLIIGDVNLGDGDDAVLNQAGGRIEGAVALGAGNDTVEFVGGSFIDGDIDAGTGVDALTSSGMNEITGNVTEFETLTILGGDLMVTGNYSQGAPGVLTVELMDGSSSRLVVSGNASLDGLLAAGLTARDLTTLEGKSYTVLTAGSISGAFDNTGAVQQGFWTLNIEQAGTEVTVTVTDIDMTIGASVPFIGALAGAIGNAAPATEPQGGGIVGEDHTNTVPEGSQQSTSLDYDSLGDWESTAASYVGGFNSLGPRTPAGAMPKTGTAAFEGTTQGALTETASGAPEAFVVEGNVLLTANFASGLVNADFTEMEKIDAAGVTSAWVDFRARMSIADGTSEFAGTAGTDDGVWNGKARGGFYGDEGGMPGHAAGLWTMSSPLGSALGGFLAKRQ